MTAKQSDRVEPFPSGKGRDGCYRSVSFGWLDKTLPQPTIVVSIDEVPSSKGCIQPQSQDFCVVFRYRELDVQQTR